MKLTREQIKDISWVAWSFTEDYRRGQLISKILTIFGAVIIILGSMPAFLIFILQEPQFTIGDTTVISSVPAPCLYIGDSLATGIKINATNFSIVSGILVLVFFAFGFTLLVAAIIISSKSKLSARFEESLLDVWVLNKHSLPPEYLEEIFLTGKLPENK